MDIANKSSIDEILKIHCRTPQVMYDIFNESYDNLSNRVNDISIYQKSLRYLNPKKASPELQCY